MQSDCAPAMKQRRQTGSRTYTLKSHLKTNLEERNHRQVIRMIDDQWGLTTAPLFENRS